MTREQRARALLGNVLGMKSFEYVTTEVATVAMMAFANAELERIAVLIDNYEPISADDETEDAENFAAERIAAKIRAIIHGT